MPLRCAPPPCYWSSASPRSHLPPVCSAPAWLRRSPLYVSSDCWPNAGCSSRKPGTRFDSITAMHGPDPTLDVHVWRGGADGRMQRFAVPRQASQTVLDVVTWIQRYQDASLAYRFACRVGMCGSCAMTVNGVPRWTCRTHVAHVAKADALEIAPLAPP